MLEETAGSLVDGSHPGQYFTVATERVVVLKKEPGVGLNPTPGSLGACGERWRFLTVLVALYFNLP